MKSSRSIQISRENGTLRDAGAPASSGLLTRVELLDLALRVVLDHELERPQHGEAPRRLLVEHVAHRSARASRSSTTPSRLPTPIMRREVAHALGREAAPADARDRGHARVVPAAHAAVLDELQQEALREHRVGEVEPRELVLARPRRHRQVLEEPVVERPVVLELERADRVRDALDRVGLAVREVVGRVDAPGVARALVRWRAGCGRAPGRAG